MRTFIFLLSLFVCVNLFAGESKHSLSRYLHDSWDEHDGLPQNSAQAVIQSADGYIWIGTQDGLVRFDGVKFSVYDRSSYSEIRSNFISALFEDNRGRMWIGTVRGVTVREKDGTFRYPEFNRLLVGMDVRWIGEDVEGNLLVITVKGGLQKIVNDGEVVQVKAEDGSLFSHSATVDSRGRIWSGSGEGVSVVDGSEVRSVRISDPGPFYSFFEEPGRGMWIGGINGLYFVNNYKSKKIEDRHGFFGRGVISILGDGKGNIWIATVGSGVILRRDGVFKALSRDFGFLDSRPISLTVDRELSVWIGTETSGLSRLREGKFTFFSHTGGKAIGSVTALSEGADGTVWAGTSDGRIFRYDGEEMRHFREGEYSCTGLVGGKAGDLFVATSDSGLFHYRGSGVRKYTSANGLASERVRGIMNRSDGGIWVFPRANKLQWLKNGNFHTATIPGVSETDSVQVAVNDRNGVVWMGTNYSGVISFDGKEFRSYDSRNGLPGNDVLALHIDREGVLWVGTFGSGLARYKNGKFVTIGTEHGLFNENVLDILEDDSGYLWFSSYRGIFRVKKSELDLFADGKVKHINSEVYGYSDGLVSREFNSGHISTAWKTRRGKLLFASVKGVLLIDPGLIEPNRVVPPVKIEKFRVDGKTIGLFPQKEIKIDRSVEKMEFDYTALSFVVPEKVKFKYRLEGYDKNWIDSGAERRAHYMNIPPGRYTFRVIAANNDGVWNTEGSELSFYLVPRFYQTFYFYLLSFLVVVGGVFFFYRLRVVSVERHNIRLAEMVRQKTVTLRKMNERLKQMSLRDPLTGLSNRRYFKEVVEPEANIYAADRSLRELGKERRSSQFETAYGIFLVDLDHFKEVNDNYGHDSGDMLLRQVADTFKSIVRKDDVVIRWGGEEFLVVLKSCSSVYLDEFAERIRSSVSDSTFDIVGGTMSVTCSVGYLAFPFYSEDPALIRFEQAVSLADTALYRAKSGGRNRAVRIESGKLTPETPEKASSVVASSGVAVDQGYLVIRNG